MIQSWVGRTQDFFFNVFVFLVPFFVCSGLGGCSSGYGDTFGVRCSRQDAEQGSGVAACLM